MKLYKVKVNGKVYEVELESVTEKSGTIAAPAAPVAPVAPVAPAAPAAPVAPAAPAAGDVTIVSPMQGTILDVKVAVGSQVKKGQTVAILEAMKLENEIVATADGGVKQVLVNKGQSVNNKQALIVLG